jgi:predicted DNA-binding transcriptional regulator AlpA
MSALLDTQQIADLIGVSRQHVTNRLSKRPDFPAPRVNLSQRTRRWSEADIRAWLEKQAEKQAA